MEAVPVDDTPSLLMKGVRFESQPSSVFHKADCALEVDLQNLGPGRVTGMMLRVRIIEKGKPNYLLGVGTDGRGGGTAILHAGIELQTDATSLITPPSPHP